MNELSLTLFNLLAARWENALAENRARDAASVAIAAYLVFRELDDPLHEQIALTWLSVVEKGKAAETRTPGAPFTESQNLPCSFCQRSKPQGDLIAGTDALICKDCIGNMTRHLKSRRSGTR